MPGFSPSIAVAALLLLCLAFGWWQNRFSSVGGDISAAKVVWLFLALAYFFVLPACLWMDHRLPEVSRSWHGLFLASWLARGVVEIPLLIFTRLWKCGYGIAHTLGMLAAALLFGWGMAPDPASRALLPWLCLALGCEALNAFLFSRAASPAAGIYFAGKDPLFRRINLLTWGEAAVLLPALVVWLYRFSPLQ